MSFLEMEGRMNEVNYFSSTYMYEEYSRGLFVLIFISALSPLIKIVKENTINAICKRKTKDKDYSVGDVSILSTLDCLFQLEIADYSEPLAQTKPVHSPNSDAGDSSN